MPSAFIYRFRLFAARAKQAEKAYEQYRAQQFGRHEFDSIKIKSGTRRLRVPKVHFLTAR